MCEVTQSCLTLGNPMDCSLPGSSIHGTFQARVLQWVAISFPTLPERGDPVCAEEERVVRQEEEVEFPPLLGQRNGKGEE